MSLISSVVLSQLIFFAGIALADGAGPRPEFVEAQMGFDKSSSAHEARCVWDKNLNRLDIHFELVWQNFDESLHQGGFALGESLTSSLLFPTTYEECRYLGAGGALFEEGHLTPSRLNLAFEGEQCLEMISRLNAGSVVLTFYEVPPVQGEGSLQKVLRLQIWDHFTPLTCE